MSDWAEVLADMEGRVRAIERYLAGEGAPVSHFAPPAAEMGPLPPELKTRAEEVLASTRSAEEKLAAAMEQVAARLRRHPAPALGSDERPAPSYVSRLA